MALVPTIAAAAIAASRDLFGARRSHSSEVHAVCKKPNQCMRGRLGTAASAAHRPTVHATHGLTRLVRAALAVVRAANVPPVRRRQGSHRALPGRCSGRCGVHAPSQYITGGRRRPGTPVSRAGLRVRVRGARGAALDGRGVVVGSRCGALALVPIWGARADGRDCDRQGAAATRRRLQAGWGWPGGVVWSPWGQEHQRGRLSLATCGSRPHV